MAMNHLTVDETVILCKKVIKGKNKLYAELSVDSIKDYLNNTVEVNIENAADAAKKREFEDIKEICQKAITLLANGGDVRGLISEKDKHMLEGQIRMNYMLDPRSAQDKVEAILGEKNKPYRYFFTENEIIDILASKDNGNSIEKIPDGLISAIEKIYTEKNQSYKALIKLLNPKGGINPEGLYYFTAFNNTFEKILESNTKKRIDNAPDISDEAALELKSKVVSQIENYINTVSDKNASWKAISYILLFPELIGILRNATSIEEQQVDGWVDVVRQQLGLKSANQAKEVIRTLAPYFDFDIPMSKFQNTTDGGGYGHGDYSSVDGSALLSLNKYGNQLIKCMETRPVELEKLSELLSEIDNWESTYPDDPAMDKFRSVISDARQKKENADRAIVSFEQMYPYMDELTDSVFVAGNTLRSIKNGYRIPIKDRKQTKEDFERLHEASIKVWGDITENDSRDEVMKKLGELTKLMGIANSLHEEYSGETVENIYNKTIELYKQYVNVGYFHSNYTKLGLPVSTKTVVIAALLAFFSPAACITIPLLIAVLPALIIIAIINLLGKRNGWEKKQKIKWIVLISLPVYIVLILILVISGIKEGAKVKNDETSKIMLEEVIESENGYSRGLL